MKDPVEECNGRSLCSHDQIISQLAKVSKAIREVLPDTMRAQAGLNSEHDMDNDGPLNASRLGNAFEEILGTRSLIENYKFNTPELAKALSDYQDLLRKFKSQLPRFQGWLLAERARLSTRRSHSAAVENWVETHRQTR